MAVSQDLGRLDPLPLEFSTKSCVIGKPSTFPYSKVHRDGNRRLFAGIQTHEDACAIDAGNPFEGQGCLLVLGSQSLSSPSESYLQYMQRF